jgi:hypothetical protein
MRVVIGVIYRFIDMIVVLKNLFNFCTSFIIFVIVLEDVTISRVMPAFYSLLLSFSSSLSDVSYRPTAVFIK